jgi:hypothetical protein
VPLRLVWVTAALGEVRGRARLLAGHGAAAGQARAQDGGASAAGLGRRLTRMLDRVVVSPNRRGSSCEYVDLSTVVALETETAQRPFLFHGDQGTRGNARCQYRAGRRHSPEAVDPGRLLGPSAAARQRLRNHIQVLPTIFTPCR